jgi:hypothetical protein
MRHLLKSRCPFGVIGRSGHDITFKKEICDFSEISDKSYKKNVEFPSQILLYGPRPLTLSRKYPLRITSLSSNRQSDH